MNHNTSRRALIKAFAAMGILSGTFSGLGLHMPQIVGTAHAAPKATPLILYFSKTGNTRAVAQYIKAATNGELLQLQTVQPYPENYRAHTDLARKELDSNARPELATQFPDLSNYDTLFIGYPCWWSTLPMAFFTFFESHNLAGKTLVPFCTHEGSGLASGPRDIARLCPQSTILEGLAVRGKQASGAQAAVNAWLKQINMV